MPGAATKRGRGRDWTLLRFFFDHRCHSTIPTGFFFFVGIFGGLLPSQTHAHNTHRPISLCPIKMLFPYYCPDLIVFLASSLFSLLFPSIPPSFLPHCPTFIALSSRLTDSYRGQLCRHSRTICTLMFNKIAINIFISLL